MTTKQARFVEEYCVDFNATQAAIRAGYSEKTARQIGSRLLTDVDISAAIREKVMSIDEALLRMSDIARASANDVASAEYVEGVDRHILRIDPGKAIAEGKGHLIRELKQTENGIEVKLHDAKDALKEILKYHRAYGPDGSEDDPMHIAPVEVRIVRPGDG